mgnify:CR=1 FL=1
MYYVRPAICGWSWSNFHSILFRVIPFAVWCFKDGWAELFEMQADKKGHSTHPLFACFGDDLVTWPCNVTAVSQLKVVWVRGSHTSFLTSFLESTGLFTTGVKISSYSVQSLWRYYGYGEVDRGRLGPWARLTMVHLAHVPFWAVTTWPSLWST